VSDFGGGGGINAQILAALDGVEGKLDTLHTDLGKLHAQAINTLVDAVVFNASAETYTSGSIDISSYRLFCLLLDLVVANAPTDIVVRVQLSDDGSTWRTLMNGPFGDLRYEDTAGDKNEAIYGGISAAYMRLYVASSGCDSTNTFTLTAKVIASK
jgi:hypothetical protein